MAKSRAVLTIKDIAEYLNLHPMTVYKHVKNGKIPAFKIGVSWRIRKDSIKKWIRENEEKGRR
ncbi:helix-turn-helix domain-containing protein [Candidatus Omnitrophota bacterium]